MTPTDAEPTSRRGWLHPSIVATAAVGIASGYAQFGVTTVLGDVAEAFGQVADAEAVSEVGLGASTLGIGLAIIRLAGMGSLPVASLADRHGRRRLLLALAAVGLALTAAASLAPGYWVFVGVLAAARPLLSGTNTIAGVVAAEETRTVDRSKAIALLTASYALGSGLVAIAHGTGALGFRGVLALSGVLLLGLPLLARWIEEPALFATRRGEARSRAAPVPRARLGHVPRGLRGRLALVSGLATGMAMVTGPAFTFLFVYGENRLGASPAYMAGLVIAAGPTGLLGLLAGRWGADHLGRRVTSGVTMAAVACAGALTYGGSIAAMSAGYLLTVASSAAFGPATGAIIAEVFPTPVRATAGGWAAAAGIVGSVIGLAAFGLLSDAVGSFRTAGMLLFLPIAPLPILYRLLPETKHLELDELTITPPPGP